MPAYRYYDPNTILSGQIQTDYYYGRPNFGETPERDELEHAIFLHLDEPIDLLAGDDPNDVFPTPAYFQISAPIQKGNSGGPVFDRWGNVIGMVCSMDAPDELALRGISLDYIFQHANAREPRIKKGNLRTVLEKFEQLQVDDQGRGLVVAYNEATAEVSVIDRQLLLYRKYCTVKWPWETLIAEAKGESESNSSDNQP